MKFQKNISLQNYTTFKIGGPAKFFCIAKSQKDIIVAVEKAKKLKLPFFILGGGSNLLFSDNGFNGVVIKNEARNLKIKKETIIAESGVLLSDIINISIKKGLSGLIEGTGIPGTIGGAIYGNAGGPKGEWAIGDFLKEAKLLMPDGKIKKVKKKWFSFGYRNSRLKNLKDKPIILEVVLELKKGNSKELKKRWREILKIRNDKIPFGFSAGSIFKNPIKKPAGYLIEKCGLKGKIIGNAKISEKHANFIINLGKARATDVLALIKLAKQKVKKKFGIILKEEIQIFR